MASPGSLIEIDGSYGEGGGVLLRTALTMSALTQLPVHVTAIREATKFPGLNSEDLTVVRALAVCCEAEVHHAEPGSSHLLFVPRRPARNLNTRLDVADSADGPGFANALVVGHALLPVLARTGAFSALQLRGETYAHHNLSADYYEHVTLRAMRRFGLYTTLRVEEAAFGWGAIGSLEFEVEPSALNGLDWSKRGRLIACRAQIVTSHLIRTIAERAEDHLREIARSTNVPFDIETTEVPARGPGAFVTLSAEFEHALGGATAMGQKGVRMESVVQRAFQGFREWYDSTATCDPHLVDQLLIPAILAEGPSVFTTSRITPRLLTTVWVIKRFVPIHVTVRGREGEAGSVTVQSAN